MVSLTSAVTLLAIVLTAGCQVASASPQPQIQGTIVPRAAAAPELGDVCDINKDRIVCADEKSLLICDRNEWVQFSSCNLGTVCRNGNCVYPEAISGGGSSPAASAPAASAPAASAPAASAPAASIPGAAGSSNAAAPSSSLAQSQPPSSTGSAALSKPASSPGVAQPTSAATKSSAAQPSSAPSSSAGGGGGGNDSGGNNFGITCDKFNK
ncbi:hypothetical protein GGI08_008703, partial [Coemansia sp. S2]